MSFTQQEKKTWVWKKHICDCEKCVKCRNRIAAREYWRRKFGKIEADNPPIRKYSWDRT